MNWNAPAPGERGAEERSWEVVRAAWQERLHGERQRRLRPRHLVAIAAAVAIVTALFTPPGRAVLRSIRDAVGTGRDEILSLPARGDVLVNTSAGVWIVHHDGSKRFLTGYADASWSPHGLYLAAARGNELVAMEPNGRVHWKLARARPIGAPIWSYEGYRIAYLSGSQLRVVNGDGTGDHLLDPNAVGTGLPAYAWRPGTHELAYENARNELLLVDVDSNRLLWRRPTTNVDSLRWSDDGRRLVVDGTPSPIVLDGAGATVARLPEAGGVTALTFVPGSDELAVASNEHGRSSVLLFGGPRYTTRRQLFAGLGTFAGLAWSPNARWLLVDWSSADQWVFVRVRPTPRVHAVSNIDATFGTGPEHRGTVAGWCCP